MRRLKLLFIAGTALAQPPAPQLSVSANGARSVDLPRGWPLLVRVMVLHPQRLSRAANVPPLRLAPPGMAWADAITLPVTPNSGENPMLWPLSLTDPPEDHVLSLGNRTMASAVWRMSPEATAALPTGSYTLTARLEIKNSDGWNGIAQSGPVTLRVVDEPSPLSPQDEASKQRLRAQFEIAGGNAGEAERILDQLLDTQPEDTAALAAKAQLLEFRGQVALAYVYAHEAVLVAQKKKPQAKEPPEELLELRARLRGRLMSGL